MFEHRPKVFQENRVLGILRFFKEQLAVTLDGIQRGPQLVAQSAALGVTTKTIRPVKSSAVDNPLDQRQELRRGRSHALEIGDEIVEAVAPRVFEQHIDETDNAGGRRGDFLTYKSGDRLVEATGPAGAAHRCPAMPQPDVPEPPSRASIFSSSRGNSTGFVS